MSVNATSAGRRLRRRLHLDHVLLTVGVLGVVAAIVVALVTKG